MSDSTFNILSFDGGGIRGALSIKLLEKIQDETPNIVNQRARPSAFPLACRLQCGWNDTPAAFERVHTRRYGRSSSARSENAE